MRLVTYRHQGQLRPGVVLHNHIADLEHLLGDQAPIDILAFITDSTTLIPIVETRLDKITLSDTIPIEDAKLAAPIPRPARNIVCVGRNYVAHAQERGADLPSCPVFFTKASNTVIGPHEAILWHPITQQLDYEAELAVVIGKAGRNISPQAALSHVFGYTIINDVTARDVQQKHQQWFKGKSLDGSCPMGPTIVTANEVADLHNLPIRLWVNDELRQSANTSEMIFTVPELIAWLSQGYTLEPGDIIATGTPSGVGAGYTPPRFLQRGDVVKIDISGIGCLCNRVESA